MCANAREDYIDHTMADPASPRPRRNTAVPSPKGLAPSKIVVHGDAGIKLTHSIMVRRPAHPLYAFCREFGNLARVIDQPVTITTCSAIECHWRVGDPSDEHSVEWDALIINDEPDQLIAWRSHKASKIVHAGTVRFTPSPNNELTEVTVTLDYVPPGGKTSELPVKASHEEASHHVVKTLERLKAIMETGQSPGASDSSENRANAHTSRP